MTVWPVQPFGRSRSAAEPIRKMAGAHGPGQPQILAGRGGSYCDVASGSGRKDLIMEYRTLGSSGASVSTLALGTMTFGTETDEATAHDQLDRFMEAGGNLVDTA